MLGEILSEVLRMSLAGSIAIIFVMLFRVLLKRMPKIFSYALWAIVLFRLICPISIPSELSLVGLFTEPIENISTDMPKQNIEDLIGPIEVDNIISAEITQSNTNIHIGNTTFNEPSNVTVRKQINIPQIIWLGGMMGIIIYSVWNFVRLKKKLIGAVKTADGVFIADGIQSPFVVGVIRPKIFLPSSLSEAESDYIICHERHHIKRKDHIVKLIAFLTLCVHWFNPLVWVAFALFEKDMEMSCDEAVIKQFGENIKSDYSQSILDLSVGKHPYAPSPLAFGESGTKTRIKNIANMKKPTVIMIISAVIIVAVAAVILITDYKNKNTEVLGANYYITDIIYNMDTDTEPPVQFCISADYRLYSKEKETEDWEYIGKFEKAKMSAAEIRQYLSRESAWSNNYKIKNVTDSYILKLKNDHFYIAVQTSDGDTLLGYGWEDVSERGDEYSDDTYISILYLLQNEFRRNTFNVNFFDRSLKYTVGMNVESFSYYETDKHPGFAVVGFKAGPGSRETMTNLGFAVFSYAGNVGYKLIDWHVYLNAAMSDDKIYSCEHPAVFSINGVNNYMNSFDVVLSAAPELHKITREYVYEDKDKVTVSDTVSGWINMCLFARKHREGAVSVMQYYYDEFGNCIGSEDVTVSSNFTDIQGTSYVSWRNVYITPISSFMPIGGDSGERYIVGDNSFSMVNKTHEYVYTLNDITYEWQKFPWTDEEWHDMFIYEVPNELSETNGMLWQPLADEYGLLEKNGVLYFVQYLGFSANGDKSIWTVYELIEESKVGFAEWKNEPYMSSKLPYFRFEVDIENYTHISAISIGGELLNWDSEGDPSPGNKKYEKGSPICWSPDGSDGTSHIYVNIFNGDEVVYIATIYIKPGVTQGAYSATVSGHGLCIKNNEEIGGAVISAIE